MPERDHEPYQFADRVFPVMRIVLLTVVLLQQATLGGPQLFGHQDRYRPALAADLAFVALTMVSVLSAAWVLRGRPLPLAVVVPGAVVSLVASGVAASAVPVGKYFTELDWSFGVVGWLLLLLLVERVAILVAALCVLAANNVVQFAVAGLPDRAGISAAAIVLLSVTSFQVAVVLVVRALHRGSRQAGDLAVERDRIATRQVLGEQGALDHRRRFAGQLGATLPLLAGMADGTVDPRTPDTQRRIVLAATQLRRLFAEHDDVPDPLVHELSACVDVAERRGLAVSLAVSGAPLPVPTTVRRALTGPVITALAAARSRARVSLLRTGEQVRVAVVADAGITDAITSDAAEIDVAWYAHEEHTRMEARWRSAPTPPD
ncbi:hypothetical protein [Actinophytocola sediminis]